MSDLTPGPIDPPQPRQAPAHRGRRIAAAVSAGAFAGIGVGLVLTSVGDDSSSATTTPVVADGGAATPQQPFAPDDFGGTEPFGGPDDFDGSTVTPDDQFSAPSDQFGSATPAPFGGQTSPDTNSGGS